LDSRAILGLVAIGVRFEAMLEAARNGADWALVAIYRELHPPVLRYLRAREPMEGEDLASEVWLDVAGGLDRFCGDEQAFRRWVFTIARRRLIDFRRRSRRRRTDPIPIEALADTFASGDAEAEAMANLGTEAALAQIARLPADQAEVVLLRVLGDLSVRDVAAVMGKRPGTVRVLQHRALARLGRQFISEVVTK
jgi:RNA polymerase sigma factor (sigma-70 family)